LSQENVELVRRLQPDGLDLVQVFSADIGELVSEGDAALFTNDFEVRFISDTAGMGRLEVVDRRA
jgi:hypothetical protein